MNTALATVVFILGLILCLAIVGLSIYALIEFIQLAKLANIALSTYIENSEKNKVR